MGEGGEGAWKVGELAKATGLTVRTLHYYDAIGLLSPSRRTAAGHRIYADRDLQRLYRISLLRRLGLPLEQIARSLDDPAWTLRSAVNRHVHELDRRIALSQRLRHRLAGISAVLDDNGADAPPNTRDILQILEDMIMLDTTVQRRISILVYEDIETAHDYLVRVFGLGAGPLERDGEGRVVHGEVQAGDGVIWLHRVSPGFGLASPKTLGASTGMLAVMVDYGPTNQPYGVREYGARGPEDELWSFMTPLD
jgi:MerR family transcriptional regulator, thiopeptide resistance regulator